MNLNLLKNLEEEIHFHLLAYNFDFNSVKNSLKKIKQNKISVIKSLVEQLVKDGYNIDIDKVKNKVDILKQITGKNYISELTKKDFDILDKKYQNLKSIRYTAENCIKDIHIAGGKIFLAHGFDVLSKTTKIRLNQRDVVNVIEYLVSLDIDGLEVYYANYDDKEVLFLENLANKYNLAKSSGTDTHFRKPCDILYQENLTKITGFNL